MTAAMTGDGRMTPAPQCEETMTGLWADMGYQVEAVRIGSSGHDAQGRRYPVHAFLLDAGSVADDDDERLRDLPRFLLVLVGQQSERFFDAARVIAQALGVALWRCERFDVQGGRGLDWQPVEGDDG